MFDVLTYQKGAGVLRMLERYLGAERFRDGVPALSRAPIASATPRPPTCGTPSRRPAASRCATSWTAGSSKAASRSCRCAQPATPPVTGRVPPPVSTPGAVLATARPAPGPAPSDRTGGCPSSPAPIGGAEARILLGAAPDAARPRAATPTGRSVVNAGGAGFYRVRYAADHLRRLAARTRRSSTCWSGSTCSATPGPSVVAGGAELDDFLLLAEALGDEDDPDVWAQVTGALSLLDHTVDDDARPACGRIHPGPARPRCWPASGGTGRPGEDPRTPTLRAQLIGVARHRRPGRRRPGRGAPRFNDAVAAAAPSTPTWPRPSSARWRPRAAAGGFELFLEHYRHPATPQEEIRYLYALAGVHRPRPGRPDLRAGPHRGAHAERPVS